MVPIIQMAGQQFNLPLGNGLDGQRCNRFCKRLTPGDQILNLAVGVSTQCSDVPGQGIQLFFNPGFYLCKLYLQGGQLGFDFFLAAVKQFKRTELFTPIRKKTSEQNAAPAKYKAIRRNSKTPEQGFHPVPALIRLYGTSDSINLRLPLSF